MQIKTMRFYLTPMRMAIIKKSIINSATMKTGVCKSFQIRAFIFSGYVPKSGVIGLQDHMEALFLVFKGISILFFTVAAAIYIPINSVGGLPSFNNLSSIYYL